jgi:hypothetical protein
MYQKVGGVADERIEEKADGDEADGGENEALTRAEDESVLQFAERDADEEGADVGERSVLEEAEELSGAVAVDGANDVIGVQVEIEGMGYETDDPKGNQEGDQLQGLLGPR